ncbi:MAG: hypothetical protein WEB06_10945 [Actinomycetota bacterium]
MPMEEQGVAVHGTWVVLLVEADPEATERLGAWLGRDGYWVLTCAGPLAPTYTCPGGQGERCPLVELADVVVLDLQLETDTMMEGVPGWQLMLYYLSIGKPVVALADPGDAIQLASDESVVVLSRRPTRDELTVAVRSLLGEAEPARLPARAETIPLRPERAASEDAVIDVTEASDGPSETVAAKGGAR